MRTLTIYQWNSLLERLNKRTESDLQKWEEDKEKDRFATFTETFAVTVDSVDKDDYPPFRIQVWRRGDSGGVLDSLESEVDAEGGISAVDRKLGELYGMVALKARGLEHLADDLLAELDDPTED